MNALLLRLKALIIKELLTLFRDPKVRIVMIAPPLLQLLLFSFAATLEVNNVTLAVYNQDLGRHGYEVVQRVSASPTFSKVFFLERLEDFKPVIDQQKAMAVLHIPQDFSRRLDSGNKASLQVLLDGRRSNAAQIVNGYLGDLFNTYGLELLAKQTTPKQANPGHSAFSQPTQDLTGAAQLGQIKVGQPQTTQAQAGQLVSTAAPVSSPLLIQRSWYNENLLFMWFTVPSLVGILSLMITLMVTSLSVAREKELGTFEQLLVSPLLPHEIVFGKTVPAMLVGVAEGLLIVLASVFLFRVPFTGSMWLLLLTLVLFVFSVVGLGLFISSLARTQQQGILGAFVFLVPAVTLSGFAAPIENMPVWLQHATELNPLRHCLTAVRGIFLKDLPLAEVWAIIWPLLPIGICSLALANWFFARRLE